VGRPREHDQRTAAALIAATERLIEEKGVAALSIRAVASDVDTSTRAVYSLFGSKEGLLAAVGAHAFELLHDGLDALPTTDDPATDLISAALMFRTFALEHPSLFAIGVQRNLPRGSWPQVFAAAGAALQGLKEMLGRLEERELLHGRTIDQATLQFHALCEGLAAIELRGFLAPQDADLAWHQAFTALLNGFAATGPGPLARAPSPQHGSPTRRGA
jgi:AcrR family transcriptional regulator